MAAERSASPTGDDRGTAPWRGRLGGRPPTGVVVALVVVLVVLVVLVVQVAAGLARTPDRDGSGAAPVAAPTPLPTPTPTETPHPDASTSGVHPGTTLVPSGPIVVTVPGTVIEGLDVIGSITVEADDVTIRDTRIRGTGGPLILNRGTGLLVEDSELDGRGGGVPAVGYRDYTLRRVDVHDVAEGPRIAGDNVTIEDSYVHDLVQVGANHTDAVQVTAGAHIVVRDNTLAVNNPAAGSLGNAAFQFGEEQGPVSDCLVTGNFFDGGNYTVNGGGGGTQDAACAFRDNVFGIHSRYGPVAHIGPSVEWDASNVWEATGRPVR